MYIKNVYEKADVYNNTNLSHPFQLTDKFSCKILVKRASKITSIKLFFGTYQRVCKGNLFIRVFLDGPKKPIMFPVSMEDIQDNVPIELKFDSPVRVKKEIELNFSVNYERSNPLAVWLGSDGICGIIHGTALVRYKFKYAPIISIVTPVYKTDLKFLKQMVESVHGQSYDKWEFILVDDASKSPDISRYLKSIEQDSRVKVITSKVNAGIAVATNAGISEATGDFIAFLDHDDLLEENALLKVVSYLNANPDTDLIYTDEDKVTEGGEYYGDFYKSDWNYRMLLSHMYTCHLSVYRSKIIKEIGGIREGYDGSQDYDLALRFIEKTRRIGHVPEVLYHWRACAGSTAQGIQNKPNARINAVRAISEHLERVGRKARVYAGPFQGHYHVDYTLEKEPLVSIVIPFKDQVTYLENLLYTMKITEYKNYEIILVDNDSQEKETLYFLDCISDPKIIVTKYEKPFNFSEINNHIVKSGYCMGDLVLFLNNDMEVMHPEWLTELVKQFTSENVSVVGGKLLYLNHQIQHAGVFVGINGIAGVCHKYMPDHLSGYFSRPHIVQEITAVTGACMMVDKKSFLDIGGFDEEFPKAFNDIDFCLRIRELGKLVVYTPYCRMYHLESMSRGRDERHDPVFQSSIRRMEEKWDIKNFKDPYYNPNLPANCEGLRWI